MIVAKFFSVLLRILFPL